MVEETLTHVSLFSGYEGFGIGLTLAGIEHRTILYVEIDKYCQQVIRQRVRDGYLNDAPIWPDVRDLDGRPFAGKVGILTAGFPCQPHSVAGKRRGAADDRNLWPDTLRLIGEMGPGIVLLENVPGILAKGYAGTIGGQLSEVGYDCRWGVVSAADAGANHLRKRWWLVSYSRSAQWWPRTACRADIPGKKHLRSEREKGAIGSTYCSETLAYSEGAPERGLPIGKGEAYPVAGISGCDVANAQCNHVQESQHVHSEQRIIPGSWWQVEPPLGRVVDGCTDRVAQLRAAGNGIVPAVVREFLRRL